MQGQLVPVTVPGLGRSTTPGVGAGLATAGRGRPGKKLESKIMATLLDSGWP